MEELHGRGTAMNWQAGRKPHIRWRLHDAANMLVIQRELQVNGFDKATFTVADSEKDARVLQLFGDDSADEFCLEFKPVRIENGTHEQLDELTREIVFWIHDRCDYIENTPSLQEVSNGKRTL